MQSHTMKCLVRQLQTLSDYCCDCCSLSVKNYCTYSTISVSGCCGYFIILFYFHIFCGTLPFRGYKPVRVCVCIVISVNFYFIFLCAKCKFHATKRLHRSVAFTPKVKLQNATELFLTIRFFTLSWAQQQLLCAHGCTGPIWKMAFKPEKCARRASEEKKKVSMRNEGAPQNICFISIFHR